MYILVLTCNYQWWLLWTTMTIWCDSATYISLLIAEKCLENITGCNQKQSINEVHWIQLAKEKGQKYKKWSTKYNHTPIKIYQYELFTQPGDNSGLAKGLAVPAPLVIRHLTWKLCKYKFMKTVETILKSAIRKCCCITNHWVCKKSNTTWVNSGTGT
jgi:hypothetical protein